MQYLKTLLKLKQNKELNYSQIPKKLLQTLKEEGLINIIGTSKKKVVINEYFNIVYKDIEKISSANSRSELSKISNSELKQISPMSGFFVNGICKLDNIILPIASKSALFLKKLPKIEQNITVVVVENFENMLSPTNIFDKKDILFIYRNKALLDILQDLDNEIFYFGDFDLAGVSIYLNELLVRNKNIKLFIPKDIKMLLDKFGSHKLYKKQFAKYKNLKSDIKEVQDLIDTLHSTQKSLEQEWFINS